MKKGQISDLLYEALETELGGVKIYKMALRCAQDEALRSDWDRFLQQTENHVRILQELCQELGLEADRETPGRQIVRHKGTSLIAAMEMALKVGPPDFAEMVAAECIVDAEMKDHQNWELLGDATEELTGKALETVRDAHQQVMAEEDEHLVHSQAWVKELWMKTLGMDTGMPSDAMPSRVKPATTEKTVKKAPVAQRTKHARNQMVKGG